MIYRLLLSSLTIFTLATCQNQNAAKTEKATTVENPKVVANAPKQEEPKMSNGLPPDEEAVKISKQEQANSNQTGVIYLKEGETQFLKEYEMNVTFKKIVEDSRCPKDVNCVWAGVATAEIELMGIYTRPSIIKLSTLDQGSKYSSVQQFNGYDISLDQLSPETTSDKGLKALQGSYKIVLKIKKSSADPAKSSGTTTQ